MTDELGTKTDDGKTPKLISNPTAMLVFSNLARGGSYLLPVPLLYSISTSAAAFWLLATTLVSLQNLLFLGAPQILVRMLAVASSGIKRSDRDPSLADLAKLIRIVFTAASAVITLLMLMAGSAAIANLAGQTDQPLEAWLAWLILALGTPLRIMILSHLTFLNGIGEIARPRSADGIAWTASGILAIISLALTHSLLLMTLTTLLPIAVLTILLRRMACQSGWGEALLEPESLPLRKVAKQVWAPSWRAGLGALLSTGSRQGGGVALAQLASPAVAAGYLLAQNIISIIMMLSAAPLQSVLHDMANHFARKEATGHIALAASARSKSLWVTATLASLIALTLIPLQRLGWGSYVFEPVVWTILAIGLFAQRYGASYLQHYTITNHVIWHWLDGIGAILNITLCIALIPILGANGAALGYLISVFPIYVIVPPMLCKKVFGIDWPRNDLNSSLIAFSFLLVFLLMCLVFS